MLSIHIYTSCIYFAHWELFPCLYYPASLLQVCHFSCSCISSSARLTSQEVLHQYPTTAWLEYLCDSIMCHAEQQQQGNEQYYKLEQSKNGQNKKWILYSYASLAGSWISRPKPPESCVCQCQVLFKDYGCTSLGESPDTTSSDWRVLLDLVGCR